MISDEYRVDGKVAIVTGAGRGIGRAIALALAEGGADVAVVARTREQITEAAEEIRKLGRKALAIPTDVSKPDQIKKAVEETLSKFGKIDILCSNAGTVVCKPIVFVPEMKTLGWRGVFDEDGEPQLTLTDWHNVLNTNLTSAFLFAQAVGPYMLKQKKGKVIITTSTNGDEGTPLLSVYGTSKAGLNVFMRCLASEWGPFNINVNAIAPGVIVTQINDTELKDPAMRKVILDMIPLDRIGEPREIALLALFLASPASDYITGQVLTIDGGAMGRGPDI
jgi:NAD(P)-dependent dehydrogenase (short-subunit alcohol dehydrogenase family)